MVAHRRFRLLVVTTLAGGLLVGCADEDSVSPSPWTYPAEPTPSPLEAFWTEGPGDFGGYRFAFTTDLALDPADANESQDIYIYDAETGGLTFFKPEPVFDEEAFYIHDPVVSDDGRYVVWSAGLGKWAYREPETVYQVYIRDLDAGVTTQASVSSSGAVGKDHSLGVSISSDGRFVAFTSFAANLVPNDLNGGPYDDRQDVFVHDLLTRETERVDVLPDGEIAKQVDVAGASGDGRVVVFGAGTGVYRRNLDLGETVAIGPEVFAGDSFLDHSSSMLALSFDGAVVAYPVSTEEATDDASDSTGSRAYIWIVKSDSPGVLDRTVLGPFDSSPRRIELSADGLILAYSVFVESGDGEERRPASLFVVDTTSGVTREIPVPEDVSGQAVDFVQLDGLSPDGRYLVYSIASRENMEGHLFVYDLVEGVATRLL